MKCSETWLREWVDPSLTQEQLCETLTMGGFEVEDVSPVAGKFTHVLIGQVLECTKHPEADRLKVCKVTVDGKNELTIVCGAKNVTAGMKVAVAMLGATLPGMTITKSKIRGIYSEAMLCSASELGFAEESDGIMELPKEAPLNIELNEYLKLKDEVIDIAITPNRGDCLSIRGIAREIATLTNHSLLHPKIAEIEPLIKDTFPVSVQTESACPRYLGRVIRQVKTDTPTPIWLKERLRRSGIRSIHPVVDVTNYVMLELGQPMHAFDLATLQDGIVVTESKGGEKIRLLDGSEQTLDDQTLVIADHRGPLAIAGVMGGLDSSVTLLTQDIFLESAYFSPTVVARQRQYYRLNSDSAYRFERGVDPTIQREAIERATQLILEIVGGNPGPVIEKVSTAHLPKPVTLNVSQEKINRVLGIEIPAQEIESIFDRLNFHWKTQGSEKKLSWELKIPFYRSDITLAEDVVEEIARVYGYNKIPTHIIRANLQIQHNEDAEPVISSLRQIFVNRGYYEIISYSFVDKKLQTLLDPEHTAIELLNPITADMNVMRTNLWPGLVNTLIYNKSRQQHRVRIFEIGNRFIKEGAEILQHPMLAGLISGTVDPEQWGNTPHEGDFFDIKADLENALKPFCNDLIFQPGSFPVLHPGQTAEIHHKGQKIGVLGSLHPAILQTLDLDKNVFIFEIDLRSLRKKEGFNFKEVAKFPEIRRDIAILLNQTIPAKAIQDTIKDVAGDWLKDVFIFDVYSGKGIPPGLKSIALALIWQNSSRTLVDGEVSELMQRVVTTLKVQLGAELRS